MLVRVASNITNLSRFAFGIGDAAYYCSLLATVIDLFPNKAATMLAASETFFGLGYTIGEESPILGKNKNSEK